MDETVVVRVLEPTANLEREVDGLRRRQLPAACQQLRERLALHVLHNDVWPAAVLAGVEDLDDARVQKLRGEPGLTEKPLAKLDVTGQIVG
jgi:hypothetical protein